MAIQSRHTLSYCPGCEAEMVICADCGNNCCNAGTGEVNGKQCGCDEAYAHQEAYWTDKDSVRFASDVRRRGGGP
jgi:hypothetical protein